MPRSVGPLKKGYVVGRVYNTYTCDKKIKLWSDFEHVAVPGSNDLSPTELQIPGDRPNYVTSLSYYAREAGYNGSIVTKVVGDDEPFIDYPEPKSHVTHGFMPFDMTHIPWENFQIIGDLTWTGSAKRYYRSKSRRGWCTRHKRFYRRSLPSSHRCYNSLATRYEYKIFQNENVKNPAN